MNLKLLVVLLFFIVGSYAALDDCYTTLAGWATAQQNPPGIEPFLGFKYRWEYDNNDLQAKTEINQVCNKNALATFLIYTGVKDQTEKDYATNRITRSQFLQIKGAVAYNSFADIETAITASAKAKKVALLRIGTGEGEHFFVIAKLRLRVNGGAQQCRLIQSWVHTFSLYDWLTPNVVGNADFQAAKGVYGQGRQVSCHALFTELDAFLAENNNGAHDANWGCPNGAGCVAHKNLFGEAPTYKKSRPANLQAYIATYSDKACQNGKAVQTSWAARLTEFNTPKPVPKNFLQTKSKLHKRK